MLLHVPIIQQENNSSCGLAVIRAVLRYYGYAVTEKNLAKALKFDYNIGTPIKNFLHFFNTLNPHDGYRFRAKVHYNTTIKELEDTVDKGIIACVIHQGCFTVSKNRFNTHRKWANKWDCGHYCVCIGHTDTHLFFMDPTFKTKYGKILKDLYIHRWHDVDETGKVVKRVMITVQKIKSRPTPHKHSP